MSLADAAVVESEFQSVAVTTVWLLALEVVQLTVQEYFYYFNPAPGHARMLWSWAVLGMALAGAVVLTFICACVFAYYMVRRSNRKTILLVCYGVPLMLLQVAVWETYLDKFPGDYPDQARLIALSVSTLIIIPLTYLFCWIFCNWCDCIWKSIGSFLYTRLPTNDK